MSEHITVAPDNEDQPHSCSPWNSSELSNVHRNSNLELTSHALTVSGKEAKLKFGIDNILQPEFGIHCCVESPTTTKGATGLMCCAHSKLPPALGLHSNELLPSWVFCTRYSDRPRPNAGGVRSRKSKRREQISEEEKRPRTSFTTEQLERLKSQFLNNRYLTEKRRQELAHELGLNESQIKIWFQNKRAKLKKSAQRAHQSATVLQSLMGRGIYQR